MVSERIQRRQVEVMLRSAIARHRDGDLETAQAIYEQILLVDPLQSHARRLLAILFEQRAAQTMVCSDAESRLADATEHLRLGNHRAAAALLREAIRLDGTLHDAYHKLGNALCESGELPDAREALLRAVELNPGSAASCNDLGLVCRQLDRLDEAQHWLERACQLDPNDPYILSNLVLLDQAVCAWDEWPARLQQLLRVTRTALDEDRLTPMSPFMSLSLPIDTAMQRRIAENYTRHALAHCRPLSGAPVHPRPGARQRLRIGYASADFRDHPTAQLMLSLFALHDRSRFQVSIYSWGGDDGSDYRRRIEQDCDQFCDVDGWTEDAIAERMASDGIDILVDLKGYTWNMRAGVFARRPAPVQVSYLGYPGTLGADFMDYIVVDECVLPAELAAAYTEQPVYLPHSYQVNDYLHFSATQTPTRAQVGLPESGFVFCCFNNTYKIDPELFAVWMRILGQVPGSVLWLLRTSPEAERNLRHQAVLHGVAAGRLIFAERVTRPAHLARHRLADLFLDTWYYNAHTTASDSLRAGVPVLTCPGSTFASRVSASLLRCLGLTELISEDRAAYAAQALRLARQPEVLAGLRQRLAIEREHGPLFDPQRFVRALESAYQMMWQVRLSGLAPRPLRVTDVGHPSPHGSLALDTPV